MIKPGNANWKQKWKGKLEIKETLLMSDTVKQVEICSRTVCSYFL